MNSSFIEAESTIPEHAKKPNIEGRILIGGKIRVDGFPKKEVLSPLQVLNAVGAPEYASLGHTPNVGIEMFMEAVDASVGAWNKGRGVWATARMEDRIQAIQKLRVAITAHRALICKLLMWEIAKNWADAQNEFDRTMQYIDDTLEAVKQLDRDAARIQFAGGIMAQIRRAPLGVVLCMGPFNYPFNETFATLIPALIMGNTVVVKVPRFGQLLWDVLLEPFQSCLPPGVINVVNGLGREIVEPAVQTGKIDVLAFIGSSPVANKIKLAHPEPHHFRGILGLDAKNPALILPDADIKLAVSECVKGSLSFNGQRCTALKILFVHESIAQDFTSKFTAAVEALKHGQPWQKDVMVTSLPDPKKAEQLQAVVADAVAKGAKICNPDSAGKVVGSLMRPVVLSNVPLHARVAIEEQFGPVVPIVTYKKVEEFEDYVVNSPYGMQVSIFGESPEKIGPLIDHLANQVCRININVQCQRGPDVYPFTGRKRSAEGTLSVTDALRSFSIRSMVAAKQDENGRKLVQGILHEDSSNFLSTHIVL